MSGARIRTMVGGDPAALAAAFAPLGWPGKDVPQFERYLAAHRDGTATFFLAETGTLMVGYVGVVWSSDYPPFADQGVPEIVDLTVLPDHRGQGIGSALLTAAESEAARRTSTIGIGVGVSEDYGPAARLYLRRGYVPDGRGLVVAGATVQYGQKVTIDDDTVLMLLKALL